MKLLALLLRRPASPPTPPVHCPRCGARLQTFWASDDVVMTVGLAGDRSLPPGDHLVLRAECESCGWAGRANTSRVLEPHLPSPR